MTAQSAASLRVEVADSSGSPIPEAQVRLRNELTGFSQESKTDGEGAALLSNIPWAVYEVAVSKPGFLPSSRSVSLRTNIQQTAAVVLGLAEQITRIEVSAMETAALVDPERTGSRVELSDAVIRRMPVASGTRGLEAVLLSFPGFAANANGAIHPRGAHNQMTYVVDGMPISDQLTGAFANAVDPSIVRTVELYTGNVPPEFGAKISGVAVITTQSGLGSGRRFGGSTELLAGGFGTAGQITQVRGGTERAGYFVSLNTLKSNRYLDQVSMDNLHNGGNSERLFSRFDYALNPRQQLRLNVMSGRSSFQLANLRSQHAAGQDQRQRMRDISASAGWLYAIDAKSTLDATVSWRTAYAELFPSAGDTPVTAHQWRQLTNWTAGVRWNRQFSRHLVRAGSDYQRFPVRESFRFAVTSPTFNPPGEDNYVEGLTAHDLSRGGHPFAFRGSGTGSLESAFVQDTIRLARFVLSLGLRHDRYSFLTAGNQWQPRVGIAFHLRETGTVLRASYNRTYQTPPNENLLLSSSRDVAQLAPAEVRQALNGGVLLISPERQNVFEGGVQQALGSRVSLDASIYHKNSRDMQDNDNFLNTGIIFPTSLLRSRTNGAEMRLNLAPWRRWSGSVSLTHFHTLVTPPFTGGLFLGSSALDLLSAGPFVIDHDQKLGVHTNIQYDFSRRLWVSGAIRYDSGLVSNPSDPAIVAADPDYSDLLPYVNLDSNPARVRPRIVSDAAMGYARRNEAGRGWELVAQMSNMANRTALYNFQSIFVGTRLIQPRTASVRLQFYF